MVNIDVPFAGEGAGKAKLAWGQQELWMAMVRQQSWLPMGGVLPVPEGRSLDDVVGDFKYMFSRYQCLRTKLAIGADVFQIVSASGSFSVEIHAAQGDPDAVAAKIHQDFEQSTYDYERDWPIRMAVVCHDGVPVRIVVVSCHLIADANGYSLMGQEVAGRVSTPVQGMQSLEQAQWQASPAGERQHSQSLKWWSQTIASIGAAPGPANGDPRVPRHWRGEFRSPALHRAIARLSGDSATVLLTLYAMALSQIAGVNPVVIRPIVSNRFRSSLADVVSTVAQSGLFVLENPNAPFGAAYASAQRAVLSTYKHAYHDPVQVAGVVDAALDSASFYNDRRLGSRAASAPGPMGPTTFRWTDARDAPFEKLFVHVDDVPGTVQLTIFFDTHFISPDDVIAVAYRMENLGCEAADT